MSNHVIQYLFNQDLAAGELDSSHYYQEQVRLLAIEIKFNVPVTETVTVTKLCAEDSFRDINLSEFILDNNDSYIFHPCWDIVLIKGDKIKIQCTNANSTGIAYGIIQVERRD